jgi:hypothetical protein
MVYGGFSGEPGFGRPDLGFGEPGFGGHGSGPGFGGPDVGFGGRGFGGHHFGLKRAVFGTLALLLDGPADAAQIVQRTSEATDHAFTPPQEVAELAIGLLAGRGLVTVDGGVATLTELGRNVLAWRGISSETAHAFLARAGQFGDVVKIRWGLFELAGLARKIVWAGTDEQKAKLADARTKILAAITEASKALHGTLAEG